MRRSTIALALLLFPCVLVAALPARAQGRRASDIVNVRNFGAVGDGVTDDYAAFRQALDRIPAEGGTLYVASGDYLLSEGLKIARGNLDIVCGNNARLIVGGRSLKVFTFRGDLTPEGRVANVRVEGCKFLDPDPPAHVGIEESHGIVLNRVDRAVLQRLEFVDIGDESVDVIRSSDVRILDSYVRGGCSTITVAHAGSLSVNSSSRVQIRGNVIENQANGSAIRVEVHTEGTQADYIVIADNQIFDPRDTAGLGFTSGSAISVIPALNRATTVTITGNQIVNPYRYGIFVNPVLGAVVSAVVIEGNTVVGGGQGIEDNNSPNHGAIAVLGGSSVGAVVGNVVQDWGNADAPHAGIRLIGNRLAVVGNAIAGVPGEAIRQTNPDAPANVILGNVLSEALLRSFEGFPAAGFPEDRSRSGCRQMATDDDGTVICAP